MTRPAWIAIAWASAVAFLLLAGCGHDGAPQYSSAPPAAASTYGQCAFCHDDKASHMVATGGHKSLNIKCEKCHADLTPGSVGPGHRRVPACAECHSQQQTHHDPAANSPQQCTVCHTPHGSPNLSLILEQINTRGGMRAVQFTNRNGLADGSYASSTHPGVGICETCHTATNHYRADGSGSPHFTTSCVGCHEHARAFAPPPAAPTATTTSTRTVTNTRTPTASETVTPSTTATVTTTPTSSATRTPSGPSATPTLTPTGPSPTPTMTPTFTLTPTASPTVLTATPTPIALHAVGIENAPVGIDDPFWSTAVALRPVLADVSTGLLYGDGQLNMTGTLAGLAGFNSGNGAELELRALHDGQNLYIRAEWSDESFSVDRFRWLFNGPADADKLSESANGWTTQRNDDKLALAFEIEAASSEFGAFNTAGCAASCHNTGSGLDMRPQQGTVDIWNWKAGGSEPLGYANDEVSRAASGRSDDAGTPIESRNIAVAGNNRSGPALEWDGSVQTATRGDGSSVTLDPAFFILDPHRVAFAGDATAGDAIYQPSCGGCHGSRGEGGIGPALGTSEIARLSRAEIETHIRAASHPGAGAYNALSSADQANVLARIRGFAGVPGYVLGTPAGSVADIVTDSNVEVSEINDLQRVQYRVMLKRRLQTGNPDDVQFTVGNQYPFGIALMDNDGRNHIGSKREVLAIDP